MTPWDSGPSHSPQGTCYTLCASDLVSQTCSSESVHCLHWSSSVFLNAWKGWSWPSSDSLCPSLSTESCVIPSSWNPSWTLHLTKRTQLTWLRKRKRLVNLTLPVARIIATFLVAAENAIKTSDRTSVWLCLTARACLYTQGPIVEAPSCTLEVDCMLGVEVLESVAARPGVRLIGVHSQVKWWDLDNFPVFDR